MSDEPDVRDLSQQEKPVDGNVILRHYDFLVDRMSPEFGLVDRLYSNDTLSKREKNEIEAEATIEKRNEILLKLVISKNAYEELFEALKKCDQSHLAKYLEADGEYKPEFGGSWPLTEKESAILKGNYDELVDILHGRELAGYLFSTGVLNKKQRNLVYSKGTPEEENKVLLEILSKGSLDGYWQTIRCLHASKQDNVEGMFDPGGVIVRIDANLPPELQNLSEYEKTIVTKITNLIHNPLLSEVSRQWLKEQLNIVGAAAKHSVSLYFLCFKLSDMDHLEQMASVGRLKKFVEDLFNCLMNFPTKINVILKWPKDLFAKSRKYLKAIEVARLHSIVVPMKTTIARLPLEILDTILQRAYLWSRVGSGAGHGVKDSDTIAFLASVDSLWFQRILRKRFKKPIWNQLEILHNRKKEMYLSLRDSLLYRENSLLVEEVRLTRRDLMAADFLTDLQIASQVRKTFKKSKRRRRFGMLAPHEEEFLMTSRGFEKEDTYSFIRCLFRKHQLLAARILKKGGATVGLNVEIRHKENTNRAGVPGKERDSSKMDVWSRGFSIRLNNLKDRNQWKSEDMKRITQQLKDSGLEILNSYVDRSVIVWIWCKSQNAVKNMKAETLIDYLYGLAHESDRNKIVMNINLDEFSELKIRTNKSGDNEVIRRHYDFLVDLMSPEFGLIDELCLNDTLSGRQKAEIDMESLIEKKNEILLQHIVQRNACEELFEALWICNQSHLVIYMEENGVYKQELGKIWPLKEKECMVLLKNYETLIDLLDCSDLVGHLYQTGVLNKRQRNLINSKVTAEEQNKFLLEILRKGTLDNYWQTIRCLHASNQSHIARIFESGGVIVRLDTNLQPEHSNLTEVENIIVTEITSLIRHSFVSDPRRILEKVHLNFERVTVTHNVSPSFLRTNSGDVDRLKETASKYKPEFGGNWPLTEKEIAIFERNYANLIDLLDSSGLVVLLYQNGVLNKRQRDHVSSSKWTSAEQNDELLEILRKGSLNSYWQTIQCLHSSNQSHIAEIFESRGVVARFDANLLTETSNLTEIENSLVAEVNHLLCNSSVSDASRLLEKVRLNLMAASK